MRYREITEAAPVSHYWPDYCQQACEYSEAGFYYEEGGCWGMALALFEAFTQDGESPDLCVSQGFLHALVRVSGSLYDYSGKTQVIDAEPTTRGNFLRMAMKAGHSRDDLRGDFYAAREIIETARELASDAREHEQA